MIPTVESLKSSPMVHRFGDVFNPPGLTNFLGCVQIDIDLTGIRSLNFAPFACSDHITAGLYVDGRYFPSTGAPITFTWYPDKVVREAEHDGLRLRSTTVLAVGRMAAVVELEVENTTGSARTVELRLGLQGGVTQAVKPWNEPLPPTERDNRVEVDEARGAVRFHAQHSEAVLIQGISPRPARAGRDGLRLSAEIAPGETWRGHFVAAIGETAEAAAETFDALAGDGRAEIDRVERYWNEELEAVYTPGNDRYSGHLPALHTTDEAIRRIYHMGALGVIYFKRDSPHSVYGRAYDTLMPRYWQSVTFIWDYFLSSTVHALLDPTVMKKYLETWMRMDIHKAFGTEYLTGGPVGPWYSVNDFALISLANDYVRWTGDRDWLTATVEGTGRRPIDFLKEYAEAWKQFRNGSELADYGGLNNLLECVSTYVHEVASLNAAAVFNMRTTAGLLELGGEADEAARLRREADAHVAALMSLYVDGKGYWRARYPDGRTQEVRHVYDLLTVLNTIPEELTDAQKREMVDYFKRELQTPTWMHALSCDDDDALFNVRPDHQWTGAYPAWPPETARGLYRIGEVDLAFEWLRGMAKTGNQGPYGQAHFAESVVEPEDGGARKAPPDFPYITDWTCSSNGSFVNVVIESIFGVRATADGITAEPRFGAFDPEARLTGLVHQGRTYEVTRDGLKPTS